MEHSIRSNSWLPKRRCESISLSAKDESQSFRALSFSSMYDVSLLCNSETTEMFNCYHVVVIHSPPDVATSP
jgi:hypothetical protein